FMVKFDRSAVEAILQPADAVTLSVEGEFAQGIFEGYDAIRVIQKGKLEAKVRIDLFATGNSQVEAVLVEEYIPNGLGVDTMTGMFTSHGLLWDVGRIEQGAQAGR
ncbi:MAG: hypothetical protein QME59_06610, partial [Candidatus Hydrothermarchaeota archaeon]|nr:hypothetical protein [Candidatus Hydrothermarchaeota archaeon]